MEFLGQPPPHHRATRVKFAETTPAVLRFHDGHRVSGQLQVISTTGGLLSVSRLVERGSMVKLMFLTHKGPVLGAAEMLNPVSWVLQPFRFVALPDDDRSRLQTAIQTSQEQSQREENAGRRDLGSIEKLRPW